MEKHNPYLHLFNAQKENQYKVANTTYKERINKLNALKKAVETTYLDKLRKALYDDFKKPHTETDLTEIYQVVGEIKHAKKHLKEWMKKQYVDTPITFLGASSWYKYEPKGVCLVISPWNFPIHLTLGPLVSAIAAGNTVILKSSEMTPNTSAVLSDIIGALFEENEVALVEGEIDTCQELLQLPFNHIFFTGSPRVGKIVMKAAAAHLSSVTLELGGKSPTVVDRSANIKKAAKKIVWGRFLNSGQACIAPDYILVHEDVKAALLQELKSYINLFFTQEPIASASYCRIVNDLHFNRLVAHLEDAKKNGGNFVAGGDHDQKSHYIAPTIVTDLKENATLLHDEVFGPILPVIPYYSTEEAIEYINSKEKPLSMYVFSKNAQTTKNIISNTRAGSTCINTTMLHYGNYDLPFGGVNHSGIGKAHGFYGFQQFSNMRSVLKQHTVGPTELLFPPYTKLKEKLTKLTIKWF